MSLTRVTQKVKLYAGRAPKKIMQMEVNKIVYHLNWQAYVDNFLLEMHFKDCTISM